MPPIKLVASPSAETAMSIRLPGRAKAGRLAVTITAATLRVSSRASLSRVFTPRRSSMPISDCLVNMAVRSLSPVPARPTTRP
jgi:hypothetical protein